MVVGAPHEGVGDLRQAAAGDVNALGVCFSEQLVEEVPHDAGDEAVDGIVTDAETISRAARGSC